MTRQHITRRARRGLAVACGATLAAAGLAPVSAQAASPVLENVHFHFSYTHIEQEIGECLDVPFDIRHDGESNARFQLKRRGSDGLEYFALRYNTRDVYTNVETGVSFTGTSVVREADLRLTDNGDGTFTAVATFVAVSSYHDASGALIGIDAGRSTGTFHVDLGDPENPEDDVLLSEELSEPVGTSSLGGVGFCELAAEQLG